ELKGGWLDSLIRLCNFYTVSELSSLWREFDIMTKLPKCTCAAREDVSKHNQLIKLMQFLMGLNDVFQPIRSSLLSRETILDVKDAFAIVSREESHKSIASSSSGSVPNPQIMKLMSLINDVPFGSVQANMAGRTRYFEPTNLSETTLLGSPEYATSEPPRPQGD
ncbi:hypothetical protein Tco_0546321, partial [Tanacetum coccineum]